VYRQELARTEEIASDFASHWTLLDVSEEKTVPKNVKT
jgi:hypothetical protein